MAGQDYSLPGSRAPAAEDYRWWLHKGEGGDAQQCSALEPSLLHTYPRSRGGTAPAPKGQRGAVLYPGEQTPSGCWGWHPPLPQSRARGIPSSLLGQAEGPGAGEAAGASVTGRSWGPGRWQPPGSDRWSRAPGDSACHASPSGLIPIQTPASDFRADGLQRESGV